MKKLFFIIICVFIMSCSSILSESNYSVLIDSEPQGARYELYKMDNDKNILLETGFTPSTVIVSAGSPYFIKNQYQVHFTKPGYQENIVMIRGGIDEMYWVNILNAGIGMLLVDPLSGAMYEIADRKIFTKLQKK